MCLPYDNTRKGQARLALVKHYLPPHWSSAYKFTVFENVFLAVFVEVDESGMPVHEDDGFHLARPALRGNTGGHDAGPLPVYELVWPLKMDADFIAQVGHAFADVAMCARAPKRRGSDAFEVGDLTQEVHCKLRRLSVDS